MTTIKISVGMPPGPDSLEMAKLAESLGYERIWFYDSAALYEDIWITLARVAEHTSIPIGTAVLVPNLRHVMTTASAIATIERIAPGRLECAWGTGATARWVLNKKAVSWAATRRYLEQLRGLLNGEVVDIEGERCQMIHHHRWAVARPITTPLLVSAMGAKGVGIIRELQAAGVVDGLMSMGASADNAGFDRHVQMTAGTVLDDGEKLSDERVKAALGPWYVVRYHGVWQAFPDALANFPLGAEWRAGVEAERPEGERHLAVHEGHVTDVMSRDREVLDTAGDALATVGWVGSAAEVRARAEAAIAAGATEIMYTPAGPDVAREMRAFAAALRG
jgi:5,10-methylenetetrahydromethanopterin reductase